MTIIIIILLLTEESQGWHISHTYIMPYISIECNLKDMNTNLDNVVTTCESRACIKFRNLSFTTKKNKVRVIIYIQY